MSDDTDLALGASYRLVEIVGRGAMGEVWRAIDRRTDEPVAAKLLRAEHVSDRDLVGRFVQERSVLVGLRDPHLVAVRDLVVEGDRLAIVMDYVGGGSLRDVVRERRTLPPALALGVVRDVLLGLAEAHDQRLVHRDIKPDNVLLAPDWEELGAGSVRLTDFGIARIVQDGPSTTTGLLGTPEYMSPELISNGEAGPATDVYGIGILLYELLAGRTPFAGPGTDYTIAHRHVSTEVPMLPVADEVAGVLTRMLAKDPRARPRAREAAAELDRLIPTVAHHQALQPQQPPEEFAPSQGPVTVVRGLRPAEPAPSEEPGEQIALADMDLGTPGPATVVRPLERKVAPRRHVAVEEETTALPWWKDVRILGGVAATLVLVVGVLLFVKLSGGPAQAGGAGGSGTVQASQPDDAALPTGLRTSRAAEYDAASGKATLTVTFTAQAAPLSGPFLVVVPGLGKTCPTMSWTDGKAEQNLPGVTGIAASCAWSVDPGPIDAQGSATATAEVRLGELDSDARTAVQSWLQKGAEATTAAVGDDQANTTAYPAQRLVSIEVETPQQIVTGRTLPVTLVPVWPNGADKLNPLLTSPSLDAPSGLLRAVAGGADGVRFTDGCDGALTVSSDGQVVTTLSVSPECTLNARVGNFTDLKSNPFSITGHGG